MTDIYELTGINKPVDYEGDGAFEALLLQKLETDVGARRVAGHLYSYLRARMNSGAYARLTPGDRRMLVRAAVRVGLGSRRRDRRTERQLTMDLHLVTNDDEVRAGSADTYGECVLCGFRGLARDHKCTVPNVWRGYSLYIESTLYETSVPSATVGEIRASLPGRLRPGGNYACYQAGDGNEFRALGDAEALDFRTCPRIFFVPPARY